MPELKDYRVTIYDSVLANQVTYRVRAFNEEAAITEAKFGYTGLFGDQTQRHKYLKVVRLELA